MHPGGPSQVVTLLSMAQFAYNSATTLTTKTLPFKALYKKQSTIYHKPIPGAIAKTANQKAQQIKEIHKKSNKNSNLF